MSLDPVFLADLVCPQTRCPLRMATAAEIARANEAIGAGGVRNRGGELVTEPLTEGLAPTSGELVIYPIRDEIPILLAAEAIPLESKPR
jgi:uncharacterized protein YbaR (Trm112 family)